MLVVIVGVGMFSDLYEVFLAGTLIKTSSTSDRTGSSWCWRPRSSARSCCPAWPTGWAGATPSI
jgi:hypothetical protein